VREFKLINLKYPDFRNGKLNLIEELNLYRKKYLTLLILRSEGELAKIERCDVGYFNSNSTQKIFRRKSKVKY